MEKLNLTSTYIIALTIIALVISTSQILIQKSIDTGSADAHIINISGRQRMLSQKITKASLAMAHANSEKEFQQRRSELEKTVSIWIKSHKGLQFGDSDLDIPKAHNSDEVDRLFYELEVPFKEIKAAAEFLIGTNQKEELHDVMAQVALKSILDSEAAFLQLMDKITFQYDMEASYRIQRLSRDEYLLWMVAIFLLVLEGLFIFRPFVRKIRKHTVQLSEQKQKLSESLSKQQYLSNQARSILSSVDEGIFLLDEDLNVTSPYSKATERILETQDIAGKGFLELLGPFLNMEQREAWENFGKKLFRLELEDDLIYSINPIKELQLGNRNDQELKYLNFNFSRIKKGDVIHRVLVTILDDTERRRTNRQLELAIEQMDTLYREVHHRIKNNLQMISNIMFLKSSVSNDRFLQDFIKETQSRIHAIARTHDHLLHIDEHDKLSSRTYLEGLISDVVRSLSFQPSLFQLKLDIEDFRIHMERMVTISLLINEIISNIIKHAYDPTIGGEILVSLKRTTTECLLIVGDKGNGINSKKKSTDKSMGLMIIEQLVLQLGGVQQVINENGTRYEIRFPLT